MPRITTWIRYWVWTFLFVLFGLAGLKYGTDAGWVAFSMPGVLQGVAPGSASYGNVLAASAVTATVLVWLFRREVKRHVRQAAGDGGGNKLSIRKIVKYATVSGMVVFLALAGMHALGTLDGIWPAGLVPLTYASIAGFAAVMAVVTVLVGFWRYR